VSAAVLPLRVLVADDEAIARKRLLRLLAAMPDVEVAGECSNAHEVLARVREGDVDVVLLDIQMPELSGIEALPLFPVGGDAPAPAVVFCTAHAGHAVSAFDVGAVDYLLKPIDGGRLRKALDRVRQRAAPPRQDAPATPAEPPPLDRLALPTRQGIVLLDPRDVTHAQLADELVTVYAAGRQYLSALSLQDLEARLPAGAFTRVHRRALVNLAHVVRLQPTEVGGYIADISGGHTVEVSRQAARDLRRRLGLR
jgi:two-component system LytT family response regulator